MHSLHERLHDFRTYESDLLLPSSMPLRLGRLLEATTHGIHAGNAWPRPHLSEGPKNLSVVTMALAMVLIAVATLVGGGATTWHYWNAEKRAAQGEKHAALQRHLDWWKGEMRRVEAARQQRQQPTTKSPSAFVATIPTTQEQEAGEWRAASIGPETLNGPQAAAFSVPNSGPLDR